MTALALRSLRHRLPAVAATFVAALLGTTMMASFATLVESAVGAHDDDRELLIIMGAVVGGWDALIVLFSVASTVGIIAEQRIREASLLRTIGATPRQVRTLIVYEAGVVTVLAGAAGAAVASIGGKILRPSTFFAEWPDVPRLMCFRATVSGFGSIHALVNG